MEWFMWNLSNGLRISLVGAWFVFTGYWLPQLWLDESSSPSVVTSTFFSFHHSPNSASPAFFWLEHEAFPVPVREAINHHPRLINAYDFHEPPFFVGLFLLGMVGMLIVLSRQCTNMWRRHSALWWMLRWRGCWHRLCGWKESNRLYCDFVSPIN
jgi:membrane protease YdiL (CAAX protease family)